nr:uncharacterized protein LOC117281854 [Nicotiana tomentosiformis]
MSVTEYEARFTELPHHAAFFIPTGAEKVRSWRWLKLSSIFAVKLREDMMRDERPRRSGSFSGTSSSARGAMARPSFRTPIPSSFSALPFKNVRKYCSKCGRGAAQQSSQIVTPAPVALPHSQSLRGGGHAVRGCPRGGGQVGGGSTSGSQARCYAFHVRPEIVASNDVIIMAFSGHMVSNDGIKLEPKKTEVVQSSPRPSTSTKIKSFLDLAGYYYRFVEGFSSNAAHLTKLTQNGVPFRWSNKCE